MFAEFLVLAALGLALASLGLVALTAYKSRAALNEFKKKSAGLPMVPGHWLHNHANFPVLRDIHHTVGKIHSETRADTIGWLYRQQFCVSTIDLDLIKILNQDEVHQHIDKLKTGMPIEEFELSIVAAGGEQWRRARRVFAPALKPKRFMTPVVIGEVQTSINKLINHIEKRLDMSVVGIDTETGRAQAAAEFELDCTSLKYSLDLVFRCFYRQPDEIDFERNDCKWTQSTTEGFKAMQESRVFQLAIIFPILVPLVDWLMWHFTPIGQWRQTIVNFVKAQTRRGIEIRRQLKLKQVANLTPVLSSTTSAAAAVKNGVKIDQELRLADGSIFEPNMFDYVIDKFLEGKLTRDEYINNSCFLMPAASKTAGDAIGHTLYLLAVDVRVQEKLRAAVRLQGVDSEYLDWVLAESLRLFTPASSGCGRITTRDIRTKEGHVVPAGTFVATLAMVIHRLARYWGPDVDEFRPERWADTSHHHPFQYMPFGGGLRVCPGREFAMFQMKTLLTELLTRYKFIGTPQPDIYHFDSPYLQTSVPYAATYVTIERL